jgi:Cu+-exporting ATPase
MGIAETGSSGTDAAGSSTVRLLIGGMHCSSCAALIEETLVDEPGIRSATVDLESARASVTFDPGCASVDDVCAAVARTGYSAAPADAESP